MTTLLAVLLLSFHGAAAANDPGEVTARPLKGIRDLPIIAVVNGEAAKSLTLSESTLQTEASAALRRMGIKTAGNLQKGRPYMRIQATVLPLGASGYVFTLELQIREPCVVARDTEKDGLLVPVCLSWADEAFAVASQDGGKRLLETLKARLAALEGDLRDPGKL